ncbi:glycosyltransferase [Leptolyngbya sp. AN02str]|uniref:glycosyltransferase n=1 Tax=Leptolyngbya sp. AN02str TaxID=3423363 RepID=UPI003D31B603
MKVVHISTYDVSGGAAIATYRLHQSLQQLGHQSYLLVRSKVTDDPTVLCVSTQETEVTLRTSEWLTIQQLYCNQNKTEAAQSYFSYGYPGFDLATLNLCQQADVIHLHWVSAFQSPATLHKLLSLNKPVVWTLHDMAPFTGGCHYSAGCVGYQHTCEDCPQLRDDPYHLPAASLQDKRTLLSPVRDRLTLVTPSTWMTACAQASQLFRQCRVETIPYALNLDQFWPMEKATAKARLGIDPQVFTLIAQSTPEPRKGFVQLMNTLQQCLEHSEFRALVRAGRVQLLIFGSELTHWPQGWENAAEPMMPYLHLGMKSAPVDLVSAYAAADVLLLSSFEDNLPNVMLEAMSCATPVIAFDGGGMRDAVLPGKTGWLVPLGNFELFGQAIVECVLNPDRCRAMQWPARLMAEQRYAMPDEAQRYVDLYHELLAQPWVRSAPNADDWAQLGAIAAPLDVTLGPSVEPIHTPIVVHALTRAVDYYRTIAERVQQAEAARDEYQQRLAAMETSKFWRLRSVWFAMRRSVGWAGRE